MCEIENRGQPLRVVELFAGVGGFRLSLHYASAERAGFPGVRGVRSNQGEPAIQKQWAAEIYRARWERDAMANRNSLEVLHDAPALAAIAALAPDVLVCGFPSQDCSVAKRRGQSERLEGKKGVLWWAIYRLLAHRRDAGCPVQYLCLESVDRLIATPSLCEGRDFAVILASLQQLGYAVEWRVVDAADYGYAPRRRRTFIVGYHESTPVAQRLRDVRSKDLLLTRGVLAQALPARIKGVDWLLLFPVPADIQAAQKKYRPRGDSSRFLSAGRCVGGGVDTLQIQASPRRRARPSPKPGALPTLLMGNPVVVDIVRALIEADGAA